MDFDMLKNKSHLFNHFILFLNWQKENSFFTLVDCGCEGEKMASIHEAMLNRGKESIRK